MKRLLNMLQKRYIVRLILYFLIVGFVPVAIFSLISSRNVYRMAVQQLEERTQNTVDLVALNVDALFSDAEARLSALASDERILTFVQAAAKGSYRVETAQRNAMQALYDVMSGGTEYAAAHIVSSHSDLGISTMKVPKHYLPPYNKNWGIFQMANDSHRPIFRTHDNNPNALNAVVFSIAVAVRDSEDAVLGYVVLDYFENTLEDILAKCDQEYRMRLHLGDAYHFSIYQSDRAAADTGRKISSDYFDESGQPRQGIYLLGEDSCLYSASTHYYGVRVYGQMPLSYARQSREYVKTATVVATTACTALCVLFALVTWQDAIDPIRKMTASLRRIGEGDLNERTGIALRQDEFGEMGKGFNRMAEQTQLLIRNIEEKQQGLRIAESRALQAQINPHFLYNTLDIIKWNAKLNQTQDVADIAVKLGKLLRAMAKFENDFVTVEEEIDLVRSYLDIQQVHYGNRIDVRMDIPEDMKKLRIPKLILQPIVENALVHGVVQRQQCMVAICADHCGPCYMEFKVADNGMGIPPDVLSRILDPNEATTGIGLKNVDRRAKLHGDGNCGLRIESEPEMGTSVMIRLKLMET